MPNGALEVTTHLPGYDVLMWSMKARASLDTFQVLRATGHTASARARGRMFLSDEGATALSGRVGWYGGEVARLRALGADAPGHARNGEFRLMRWRENILSRVQTETQTGRTNRSIDAILEVLRVESLDPNAVETIE